MASRQGRCWYCGEEKLQDDDPPEHVVPFALGGELTTDRVCRECNTRAGVEIDQPFLSDWFVAWERLLWDIRDTRHGKDRPPPMPREQLELADGTRVRMTREYTVEVIPGTDKRSTPMRIVAGSADELNEIIEKVQERAKRDGRELTLGELSEQTIGEVSGRVAFDGVLWLRATTKIAVAAASLVLDETWVTTPQAKKYREFLWAAAPTNLDGKTPATTYPARVHPPLAEMVKPPTHLLMFFPQPNKALFRCHLFGDLSAGTVAFDISELPPRDVWELDPLGRTVIQKTLDDLLIRGALRIVQPYLDDPDEGASG
jgi:hypothetical protein